MVSVQQRFAGAVLDIVHLRGGFPQETRYWAGKTRDALSQEPVAERIGLIISWWKNNKDSIQARRYAEATWLPRYKGRPSTLDYIQIEERARDLEPKRPPRAEETPPAKPDHWSYGKSRPLPAITTIKSAKDDRRCMPQDPFPWQWISLGAFAVLLAGFSLRRKLMAKAP